MKAKKIHIPLSEPDINDDDINRVVAVLKSGWITTGPVVREFETLLAAWLGVPYVLCLNSATAGMELILRAFGIGDGDEVITTVYTYAATANVIRHTGARAVLVDTNADDFSIDPSAVAAAMSPRTKAIIPVDFGGAPCDYAKLHAITESARKDFRPANSRQEQFGRPIILSDAAHSLGSRYKGERVSPLVDFAVYSLHAVKNLTTAEGGIIAFRGTSDAFAVDFARSLRLLALHGQTKDALAKLNAGNWEYEIELCGYKHNMTDMQAALGIGQLARYEASLARRKEISEMYCRGLQDERFMHPAWVHNAEAQCESSYHLYPLRIRRYGVNERNALITRLAECGIAANVHYKPLPLFSAYADYAMKDYPKAYAHYEHEITLPLWAKMSDAQASEVIDAIQSHSL